MGDKKQAWRNRIVGHGEEPLEGILFNPANWRIHPKAQQDALEGVLSEVGWVQDVIINKTTGHLVDGHLRCQVAARNGEKSIPVVYVELSEEEEALVLATIDPIAAMAATDKQKLDELMRTINSDNEQVQQMLSDLAEREGIIPGEDQQSEAKAQKTLNERFVVPPFSVLDARLGYWLERKRAWIALGIHSEEGGRSELKATGSLSGTVPGYYDKKKKCEEQIGRALSHAEFQENYLKEYLPNNSTIANTSSGGILSIFDPVLCELVYRWFIPGSGSILDPFAGGSVRGVVAARLGHKYTGIDLRPEQIEANEQQARAICPDNMPRWITGDSRNVKQLASGEYDLIFSCPPYFDLEVYSEDPADLSTTGDYAEFIRVYREIVAACVAMLKENRFACFVVGDIRDKRGFYRNFVSDTIAAFQDAGAILYNDAVMITNAGSLPIRVGKQFQGSRKLGKTHQNVLVFYKGNPKAIKNFGEVECGEIEKSEGADEIPD